MIADVMTTSLPHMEIRGGSVRLRLRALNAVRNCPTCRPPRRSVIATCKRHSGSASSRRAERRLQSSTSSIPHCARASRRRNLRAPREAWRGDQDRHAGRIRQIALRRAFEVDSRRQGGQHQGRLKSFTIGIQPHHHVPTRHARRSRIPHGSANIVESQSSGDASRTYGATAAGGTDGMVSDALLQGLDRAPLAQAIRRNGRHPQ